MHKVLTFWWGFNFVDRPIQNILQVLLISDTEYRSR